MSDSITRIALFVALVVFTVPSALGKTQSWDTQPFAVEPNALLVAAAETEVDEEADIVVLLEQVRYQFDEGGKAEFVSRKIYHVRTQQGARGWNSVSASWQPWRQEKPDIRARVVTKDGQAHELDPKTIGEAAQESGFDEIYSDRRVLRGPLPAVGPGSVVVTEVAKKDTRPAFDAGASYRYYFSSGVPVRRSHLEIRAPKSLRIRHVLRKAEKVKPQRTEQGEEVVLSFEAGPYKGVTSLQPNLPKDAAWFPHVTFGTGESWAAVAQSYREVLDEQIADDSVDAVLADLPLQGPKTALVERLTRVLHDHVRYTGVEFGEASYVPRKPSETLTRRYGDCKDKATLLIAMLRAAEIKATLALLRTTPGTDVEPEVPGFGLFDHAIVYVPDEAEPLWIDATDPHSRLGELPISAQGSLALIADEQTTALVRTPSSSSKDNRSVETREFFLSPFGGARVVETTHASGSLGRYYRGAYSEVEGDDLKEIFTDYVEESYLSDNLVDVAVGDPFDFSKPYEIRLEIEEAFIGATGVAEAAVFIPVGGLLQFVPYSLLVEPDEDKEERTEDYVFSQPHTIEWQYRIVPPLGYEPRDLPESGERNLGAARFQADYTAQEDHTVLANFRFDSGDRRLTPEEFRETRKAIHEFAESDTILIGFDQIGEAHLAAGELREAIEEFRRLRDAEPESAIHYTRIAHAMLEAGLGETARQAARKGVALDPDSSLTQRTLGWILEHDLIGRRFENGSDYAGAEGAYRAAIEADPEDIEARASLAILLEHDQRGERYGQTARLEEAIEQYRALFESEDADQVNPIFQTNLVAALAYAERFEELQEYVEESDRTELESYRVAAKAVLDGAGRAAAEVSRTLPEARHAAVLVGAGRILMLTRQYEPAADLFSAAARRGPNAAQLLGQAGLLKTTRRHETLEFPTDRPLSAVDRMLLYLFDPDSPDNLSTLLSRHAQRYQNDEKRSAEMQRAIRQTRTLFRRLELPSAVALDLALSGRQASVEGDDRTGYRISVQTGPQKMTFFVIKEADGYRILDSTTTGPGIVADLAREVLARAEAGELPQAAKLLDWVADIRPPVRGDDLLAEPAFARLWTKGNRPVVDSVRYAAAALLAESPIDAEDAIEILQEGRDAAESEERRVGFDIALLGAFNRAQRYDQSERCAKELLARYPDSDMAFGAVARSLMKQGSWDEFDRLVEARIKEEPDAAKTIRTKSDGALNRGDLETVIATTEKLKALGQVQAGDLNNRAWAAVVADQTDERAVEAIEQAIRLAPGTASPNTFHTQAAVYAELGRAAEARQILLQYLLMTGLAEPDSAAWYVLGRIAEAYGEVEAARAYYERVEPPENPNEIVDSSYAIVQRRLSRLDS